MQAKERLIQVQRSEESVISLVPSLLWGIGDFSLSRLCVGVPLLCHHCEVMGCDSVIFVAHIYIVLREERGSSWLFSYFESL